MKGRAKGHLLVVDDERSMCALLEEGLGEVGYRVRSATSGDAALAALAEDTFDLVLTDLNMRGMDGLALCAEIRARHPQLPVVVLTAFGSMEAAIEAIRAGAYDFVNKPVELDALELVVDRAVAHRRLTDEVHRLRSQAARPREFAGIIGESPAMRRVFERLPRAARADVPALVVGETGTGKELVARALHEQSSRAAGPFVAINCAAVPEALLEGELFGHVRGAFTDARRDREGLFVQAGGGTLFLDEVGELPLALQPKLLRALQERRVRPLGGARELAFDCRVLSATNRDLRTEIETGRFRQDLYYRLNVLQLDLPPLRARAGDILLLAQHFLRQACARTGREVSGLSTPVARCLMVYPWPGNVRELQNCIEHAVALTDHDRILVDDLPSEIRRWEAAGPSGAEPGQLEPLEEVVRRHILRVLDAVEGNKSLAAQILQIDRKTLYRKIERYARDTDPPR